MTAPQPTPPTGESVTGEQNQTDSDREIQHGPDCAMADCGSVDVDSPVVEAFVANAGRTEIHVDATATADTKGHVVSMTVDTAGGDVTLSQFLTPEQARSVGVRLLQAANVADSDPADVDELALLDELDDTE
jgi:hypothetical protein